MEKGYVAVLDSSVGGISVLKELVKRYPNEQYLYFGDYYNAPYGNKNLRQLLDITKRNIDFIKRYPIKLIVLGCNTLSVTLKEDIECYAGVRVFGIYPPVETTFNHDDKTLLLATVKTAKQYIASDNLHVVGLKDLARDIENNISSLTNVNFSSHLECSVGDFCNKKNFYKTVILGCTHYEFIKNQIFDHFCPQNMISGVNFLVKNLSNTLISNKTLVNHNCFDVLFIGDNARVYRNAFGMGG